MCEAVVLAILVVLVMMIITAYLMGWLTRNSGILPFKNERLPEKAIVIPVCPGCGVSPCRCAHDSEMKKILTMPADSFNYQCDGAPFELMPKWGGPCVALPGGTCGNYMLPDQMRESMCGSCALPNCYYEHMTAGPKDRAKYYYLTGTPDTMLFNNM